MSFNEIIEQNEKIDTKEEGDNKETDNEDTININEEIKNEEICFENENEENKSVEKQKDEDNKEENSEKKNNENKTPRVVKKIKKKRKIQNLRPFRNSYYAEDENVILEDPELDTIIELETSKLEPLLKLKLQFMKGSLNYTIFILFLDSPIIIILFIKQIFIHSLIFGILGFIFLFFLSCYTSKIILNFRIQTSYHTLDKIFELKVNNIILNIYQVSNFLLNLGISLIYIMVSYQCFEHFITYCFNDYFEINPISIFFFQLFLIFQKKQKFKKLLNCFLIIIIEFIFLISIIINEKEKAQINLFNIKDFFLFFPILILSLTNHNNIFEDCNLMKFFTYTRGTKAVRITLIFQLLYYLINGISLSLIKNNDEQNPYLYFFDFENKENFIFIFELFIGILCSFNSSNYITIAIENYVKQKTKTEQILSIFLLIICDILNYCFLSMKINIYIWIIISVTSFCALNIGYLIPLFSHLYITKNISNWGKIKNIFIMIILIVFQIISFVIMIMKNFN